MYTYIACTYRWRLVHNVITSGILTHWHIPSYTVIWPHIPGIWPHIPCPVIWGHIPSISRYILFPNVCTEYITVYTFPKSIWRHIPSISRYRYITVYDGSWPSYVSIWQIFSTYSGHGYWCSWYKNSYIWYMLAHPALLCSRMLLWLVYACSSCAAFFPAAPGWPAWMRHICCARKAR